MSPARPGRGRRRPGCRRWCAPSGGRTRSPRSRSAARRRRGRSTPARRTRRTSDTGASPRPTPWAGGRTREVVLAEERVAGQGQQLAGRAARDVPRRAGEERVGHRAVEDRVAVGASARREAGVEVGSRRVDRPHDDRRAAQLEQRAAGAPRGRRRRRGRSDTTWPQACTPRRCAPRRSARPGAAGPARAPRSASPATVCCPGCSGEAVEPRTRRRRRASERGPSGCAEAAPTRSNRSRDVPRSRAGVEADAPRAHPSASRLRRSPTEVSAPKAHPRLDVEALLRRRLHELDARHGGVVALAGPELEDPGVAAVAVGVARADLVKSLWAISLSPRNDTTWRWWCRPPFLALVISFSATGRSALALASVVTMPSAANSDADQVGHHRLLVRRLPPKRRPFFGVAGMALLLVLRAQRQAALVELLDDLVERLLAEVGDGQQVVLGLLEQLADRVDLRPLEAVAGALGQVEVLDGQVEVGRAGRGGGRPRRARGPGARRSSRRRAAPASAACRRRRPAPRGA